MYQTPKSRITPANRAPINPDGNYVLYWMIANRRPAWNFSLDRAMEWARELKKPLLALEALRCGHEWACERFHGFVLNGMKANSKAFKDANISYYPYIETSPGMGKGLIEELSRNACVIVTDNFPCFFLPRMVDAAAKKSSVLIEKVDSNGLIPISATQNAYPSAYAFRRFIQNFLPKIILERPNPAPFDGAPKFSPVLIDPEISNRWPSAADDLLDASHDQLAGLPIDHNIKATSTKGGFENAVALMNDFFSQKLSSYGELRNVPDLNVSSGLSPYLHWGHISVHQVFWSLMGIENWTPEQLGAKAAGKRTGWWGVSPNAESFLDELVTWREVGFNMCAVQQNYDQYESLPEWAIKTLKDHENDFRPYLYSLEEFENAQTHDSLWNAAQTELVLQGRIHNYLRMLWGKKILEWTQNSRQALEIMIQLNNKYALDGRNPNSYSGIFWILGRYDRPWGPERSIFGKIRYMSSERTKEKVSVKKYLVKYQSKR